MSIRKIIFTSILLSFFSLQLFAEVSIVFSPGIAYLYGDIGGTRAGTKKFDDFELKSTRYMLGGGILHRYSETFSHRINFAFGNFTAFDNEGTRLERRGYGYDTQLFQAWWQPEFTLLKNPSRTGGLYLFSGVGLVHSKSNLKGSPLRPYDLVKKTETALLVPLGIGYRAAVSENITLGVEAVAYYYFSDYIDGVSTKWSSDNDAVGAVLLTFSYKIFGGDGEKKPKRVKIKNTFKCSF